MCACGRHGWWVGRCTVSAVSAGYGTAACRMVFFAATSTCVWRKKRERENATEQLQRLRITRWQVQVSITLRLAHAVHCARALGTKPRPPQTTLGVCTMLRQTKTQTSAL